MTQTTSRPALVPRPTLIPGLARLWRSRHTLQLGLDPERAVVLELAEPATGRLLDLLDGAHSEQAILDQATRRFQVSRSSARTLLDTLTTAGLVVPAHSLLPRELTGPARARLTGEATALALRGPDTPATPAQLLRHRRAARIMVTGHSRLAAPITLALAQAGIGHLDPVLDGQVEAVDVVGSGLLASDVGRPRAAAVRDAIDRAAPGTDTRPLRRARIDLVVQAGSDRPAELLAAGYARRRQPHLLVGVRDGVPVVGPLVRPPTGPCLNCLDLHRQDRDPDWPTLAAQLAGGAGSESCSVATLLAAVAYALTEILALLDGEVPETVGGAVEINAAGRHRRRAWPPHPGCDCGTRRAPQGRSTAGGLHPRTAAGRPSGR